VRGVLGARDEVHDVEDLHVVQVTDGGAVMCRLPSGAMFQLDIGADMVPYYRRLIGCRAGGRDDDQ